MKKIIAQIVIALVLVTIGGLGYLMYNKFAEAEKVRKRIATLPQLELVSLLSNHTDSAKVQPVIINYFNSKCQFCLSEIQSIQQHKNLRKEAKVLFISDESKRRLEVFSRSFGLDTSRVEVAWDSTGLVKKTFGVEQVPVTFVYRADRSLIKSFKGETKAEVLYELIK
ncbi:MAG: redoxin domain-containing protein [Balneolaceae bacterium]|nr:redoxin domain-containing protein [Balneolaceae bacterium]